MAQVLLMTNTVDHDPPCSLSLLEHHLRIVPARTEALVAASGAELLVIDASTDLAGAKSLCRIISSSGLDVPVLLTVSEGGFAAVTADWGVDDVVLSSAGPAETDARIRLLLGRRPSVHDDGRISASGVTIDESSYSAKVHGRTLDLTFKEFELLRFLTAHPGRVFTRDQLLSDVWGYDYFGGTRTVDVHVRRLRAKLGDYDSLIGTVRNVGYRFTVHDEDERSS